jgi:PAS domain S-box-containing protein
MKNKIQPNQNKLEMKDDDFIVSKTNLKGQIIYANQMFVHFSGYRQSEIYNHQHSLVRHPDMPKAVFELLWQTIKSGKEFNGYVKNMHKSGSYYWVNANVTPSLDNRGQIVGYYSVRRKPTDKALAAIQPLYQAMLSAEKRTSNTKDAIAAGTQILQNTLEQQGMDYDQFVLSL